MPDQAAPGHEEMDGLLAHYEMGTLPEDERIALEAHVLECDRCFAELERGSAVSSAMRAARPRLLKILAEAPASRARLTGPGPASRIREFFQVMPRAWVAIAVLGILIIGGTFWQWGRHRDYSRLASFPREEVTSDLIRGPRISDTIRELMETGAGYFETGRFPEAERYFRAALDRDPTAAEASYFLGLCRIFSDDVQGAIPYLEKSAGAAQGEGRSRALWVLANANLKARRLGEARRVLDELATANDEYAEKARHLLTRLPR